MDTSLVYFDKIVRDKHLIRSTEDEGNLFKKLITMHYLVHIIEQPNFRIPNSQYLQQNFVYLIFCFIKKDLQSAAPSITLSKRASKKCVSQKNQNKNLENSNILVVPIS